MLDPDHIVENPYWRIPESNRIGCGEIPRALKETAELLSHADWLMWAQTGMEPEFWIQGDFSHIWWEKVEQEMKRQQLLLSDVSPYSLDFIQHHPDFQLILNMRYCNYLLNNLGVEGTLPLTLTMPLGAVELTLVDAAMLYNGLLTGQRTKVEDDSDKGNILIERIECPAGEVLSLAPQTQQYPTLFRGCCPNHSYTTLWSTEPVAGQEYSKHRKGCLSRWSKDGYHQRLSKCRVRWHGSQSSVWQLGVDGWGYRCHLCRL